MAGRAPVCLGCRHFMRSPLDIEAAMPGLSTLSSGFASVRSTDGLCTLHDRYLSGNSSCDRFEARIEAPYDSGSTSTRQS